MWEGSEFVEFGSDVYEFRRPQISYIFREYTDGEGRVTALGSIEGNEKQRKQQKQRFLVGTSTGRVFLHDPWETTSGENAKGTIVYKDTERRQISSVGGFSSKFDMTVENPMQRTKCKQQYFIFVQVRTFGVIILKDISDSPMEIDGHLIFFSFLRSIEIDHVGFCPTRFCHDLGLFMPTSDQEVSFYSITSNPSKPIRLKNEGAPMCLDLLGGNPVVGSEDGVVAIYKINSEKDGEPYELSIKEKIFDSPVFSLIVYNEYEFIVVGSVGHPIKVLSPSTLTVIQSIDFPASARACGSLASKVLECGASSAMKNFKSLCMQFIAGFWDGSIRIYRKQKNGQFIEKNVIESQQSGDSRSTTSLVWMPHNVLYSACEDGNLYEYEFFKKRKLDEEEKKEYLRRKERN